MTARHAGPTRYRSTPAHYAVVLLAVLATIVVVIGMAAGLRAGLVAAGLLIGLPFAAVAALVLLCLAIDGDVATAHRRARRRAGLDGPADVELIEDQALTHLARRLDQEA